MAETRIRGQEVTIRISRNAVPERTITDTDLYELGPVTFPASEAASAALRSTSDDFFDRLTGDPLFVARFTERVGVGVVEKVIASLPPDGRNAHHPERSAVGQLSGARSVRLDGLLTDIQRLRRPA